MSLQLLSGKNMHANFITSIDLHRQMTEVVNISMLVRAMLKKIVVIAAISPSMLLANEVLFSTKKDIQYVAEVVNANADTSDNYEIILDKAWTGFELVRSGNSCTTTYQSLEDMEEVKFTEDLIFSQPKIRVEQFTIPCEAYVAPTLAKAQ